MSNKKGKQVEEDEFETNVRSTFSTLCQDVKEIKESQAKIQNDLQQLKSDVSSNKSEIKKIRDSTDKATGDIHVANCRIDRIEGDLKKLSKDVSSTYERLVSLERYSRDFNLRFYNIPGKNFRTAPYINYAYVLLSSKTMTYSQVY